MKLQELFGLRTTPRLGPRREPITFSLLAPNGQICPDHRGDFESFWSRTYPEVRKELRGALPQTSLARGSVDSATNCADQKAHAVSVRRESAQPSAASYYSSPVKMTSMLLSVSCDSQPSSWKEDALHEKIHPADEYCNRSGNDDLSRRDAASAEESQRAEDEQYDGHLRNTHQDRRI